MPGVRRERSIGLEVLCFEAVVHELEMKRQHELRNEAGACQR